MVQFLGHFLFQEVLQKKLLLTKLNFFQTIICMREHFNSCCDLWVCEVFWSSFLTFLELSAAFSWLFPGDYLTAFSVRRSHKKVKKKSVLGSLLHKTFRYRDALLIASACVKTMNSKFCNFLLWRKKMKTTFFRKYKLLPAGVSSPWEFSRSLMQAQMFSGTKKKKLLAYKMLKRIFIERHSFMRTLFVTGRNGKRIT